MLLDDLLSSCQTFQNNRALARFRFAGITPRVRDFLGNLCTRTHPFYSNRDVLLRSALVQE
jgi:hypothetical protein